MRPLAVHRLRRRRPRVTARRVVGGSSIKRGARLFLVSGAMASYLLIAVATFLLEALGQ